MIVSSIAVLGNMDRRRDRKKRAKKGDAAANLP
jgi:hypothetical protein